MPGSSPGMTPMILSPPRMLPGRLKVPVALHRRAHQEAIAFADHALGIALLDMRMADHDIVLLAGVDHALHPYKHDLVLVLARIAELLGEVAFADQDGADARHVAQNVVEIFDAARVFDLQDAENLALRIERPDVGLLVILLLGQAPIARRRSGTVAADTGRLEMRRALEPRIAAGARPVWGVLNRGNVWEHDTVAAHVERLLGLPLRHFDAVHRYARQRRHRRCHRAGFGDLGAVEHVLQAIAQQPAVPGLVLHLEDAAVELRGRERHRDGDLGG